MALLGVAESFPSGPAHTEHLMQQIGAVEGQGACRQIAGLIRCRLLFHAGSLQTVNQEFAAVGGAPLAVAVCSGLAARMRLRSAWKPGLASRITLGAIQNPSPTKATIRINMTIG